MTTGIILAGGNSSRFGENKAFVKIAGRPMIEYVIDILSQLFSKIIIVTNSVESYRRFGVQVVRDIIPAQGPLSGIHAGLKNSLSFHNFVVACDMPFLKRDLIIFMRGKLAASDVLIPRFGEKVEPLHAFYSRNCIGPIEKCLNSQNLKITDFIKEVKAEYVEAEEIGAVDPSRLSFVNINTREDHRGVATNHKKGVEAR